MNLSQLLEVLISGAGGSILYPLLNSWAWFQEREANAKRWITIGISAVLGVVAFVVASVVMQYAPTPATPREWAETIFNILLNIAASGAGTYAVSQMWHARDLKQRGDSSRRRWTAQEFATMLSALLGSGSTAPGSDPASPRRHVHAGCGWVAMPGNTSVASGADEPGATKKVAGIAPATYSAP